MAGGHAEALSASTQSQAAPGSLIQERLVHRSVVQLLVLGWSRGEDGRHGEDGGGSGRVPHLVDHDGGQGHAQDLQDRRGVIRRPFRLAQAGSASSFTSCSFGTIV